MRSVILVELVIEGDRTHASEVVENMLENGGFQDPINACAADNGCGQLKVLSARQIGPTKAQEASALTACNNMIEQIINESLDGAPARAREDRSR